MRTSRGSLIQLWTWLYLSWQQQLGYRWRCSALDIQNEKDRFCCLDENKLYVFQTYLLKLLFKNLLPDNLFYKKGQQTFGGDLYVWLLRPMNHLKQTRQLIWFPSVVWTLLRAFVINQSILQSQWSITAYMDEDWPLIIQFVRAFSRF